MSEGSAAVSALPSTVVAEPAVRYVGWRRLVWRRLRRHPLALTGGAMLAFIVVLALLGPLVAPQPVQLSSNPTISEAALLLQHDRPPQLWPPSWRYLLGTDQNATPVLWDVLNGAQVPLEVGALGALLATFIGVATGALSGYLGGWPDTLWMRVVDTFLAMPLIPLLLLATTSLAVGEGATVADYVLLFAIFGWPSIARLVRGYVLSLREWEFVDAARAMGLSEPAIVYRHILPNVLGVIVVAYTLNIAVFMATEVTVEFLSRNGPAAVTWGLALGNGYELLIQGEWWVAFFPALAVLLAVLGANLFGDGLRDAIQRASTDPVEVTETRHRAAPLVARRARRCLSECVASLRTQAVAARARVPRTRLRAPIRGPDVAGRQLGRLAAAIDRTPRAVRSVPLLLTLAVAGFLILLASAPRTFAVHYEPPTVVARLSGPDYASTQTAGGSAVLYVNPANDLVYRALDRRGRVVSTRHLRRRAGSITDLALSASGHRSLAVWAASDELRAAILPASGAARAVTLPSSNGAERPSLLALPHGAFGVLLTGAGAAEGDIELVVLRSRVPPRVVRLVHAGDITAFARGVVDRADHLDLVYLQRCCSQGAWELQFRRFTLAGRPLGAATVMTTITSLTPFDKAAVVPGAWGTAISRDTQRGVWAAGFGDYGLYLGHWSAIGNPLWGPQHVPCVDPACGFSSSDWLGLGAAHGLPTLYFAASDIRGVHPYAATVTDEAGDTTVERVAYDYGGGISALQVAAARSAARVFWEKHLYSGQTLLETTSYQGAASPGLAARLGLNVGPIWGNGIVVALGALLAAVPLTAANVSLIGLLLLVWAALGRLTSRSVRWPAFVAALTLIVAWTFVADGPTRVVVFALRTWSPPWGWIAVGAAVVAAAWTGRFLVGDREEWFRALSVAATAVYVLAVLSALAAIQSELASI